MGKIEGVILKDSKKEGQTSVILAGIHGNEVCGIKAFEEILPNLRLKAGKVYFVYGNLRAIKENVRYTEFNMNRVFFQNEINSKDIKSTYEYKRAQEIKEVLKQAENSMDIHSTTNPNGAFFFAEENSSEIASFLPEIFKYRVIGISEVMPGTTLSYCNEIGHKSISVECGQHEDSESVEVAKGAIYAFLEACGHIDRISLKPAKSREVLMIDSLYKNKNVLFTLAQPFKEFSEIKEGTLIGTDGEEEVYCPKDSIIMFPLNCKEPNRDAFLLAQKMQ